MTFDEAKEIIKRMIDSGRETGDSDTKALEIILKRAEKKEKSKQKNCLFCFGCSRLDQLSRL